ncbi:MAG: lipid-A-disaccharide synthase [Bacteroidetes bacterium]|nr:lipid-A-disaccharide synthase [Flavobacteriaceae bacterium]MDA0331208.1 lipid-A-disaccharide synthase [Bacteroidota bacterium]MDA0885144.1 lipid-A-disaccharide synthase [Bacteroidota bacterium]
MKYYIIAGEASGDLYGSRLITELKSLDNNAEIRFWGGDKMVLSGGTIVKHIRDLAFMGFYEVIKNIDKIFSNISFCKKDILAFNPDKIIYIDYPGFNLRICDWAKKKGFSNYYYISPQIWAWKEGRIKKIKRNVDKLYVIFPFEKKYYNEKHNIDTFYFGHPLIEAISSYNINKNFFSENNIPYNKPIIAFLPGSRIQEIKTILPIFLSIISNYPNYNFIIAGVNNVDPNIYNLGSYSNLFIVYNKTYDLLTNSFAAIVTSGTASLECSLFKIPQIVCYKTSHLSYFIGKLFVKLKYISLVNIILEKGIVKELIQDNLNKKSLAYEFNKLCEQETRSKIIKEYSKIFDLLSVKDTSKKIASSIIN